MQEITRPALMCSDPISSRAALPAQRIPYNYPKDTRQDRIIAAAIALAWRPFLITAADREIRSPTK